MNDKNNISADNLSTTEDSSHLITSVNELGVGTSTITVDRASEEIQSDIRQALQNNPDVDGSRIEAQIENGSVVLSGTVAEERERTLTEGMVKNLQGVRAVLNKIEVENRVVGP